MNTQDITDAFNNLRAVAGSFRDALDQMGRILEAAVHDLKDRDEQIRTQQERIAVLEEDNKRLQERLAASEEQVWQGRRSTREANDKINSLEASAQSADEAHRREVEALTKERDDLKTEGVRLREIILNVATSVDAVMNPKKASEVAPVNPTSSTPAADASAAKEDTSSGSSTEPKYEEQNIRSYGNY